MTNMDAASTFRRVGIGSWKDPGPPCDSHRAAGGNAGYSMKKEDGRHADGHHRLDPGGSQVSVDRDFVGDAGPRQQRVIDQLGATGRGPRSRPAARLAYSVRLALKDSKWWALALSSRMPRATMLPPNATPAAGLSFSISA